MFCSKYIDFTNLLWIYLSFSNICQSNTQTSLLGCTKQAIKILKYYNSLTFSMFGTCFSIQTFFPILKVSKHYYSWTISKEWSWRFTLHLTQFLLKFSWKLCITLVSLLESDNSLLGPIEHFQEHVWLKPRSFIVYYCLLYYLKKIVFAISLLNGNRE